MRRMGRVQAGVGAVLVLAFCVWAAPRTAAAEVYGDAAAKKYHTPDCPEKARIKPRDLKLFEAEAEAGAKGYYPCPICIPPVGKDSRPDQSSRKLSQPVSRASVYIGDISQGTYHYPWCRRIKGLPTADLKRFPGVEKAVAEGFARCGECNPPMAVAKIGRVTPAKKPAPPPAPEDAKGLPPEEKE
jgi:hypothetical protein